MDDRLEYRADLYEFLYGGFDPARVPVKLVPRIKKLVAIAGFNAANS